MALTYLLRCSACDREIRGFDSRLGQKLQPGTMLTEGGVSKIGDGTAECPFCGTRAAGARGRIERLTEGMSLDCATVVTSEARTASAAQISTVFELRH